MANSNNGGPKSSFNAINPRRSDADLGSNLPQKKTRHELIETVAKQKKLGFFLGDIRQGLSQNFKERVEAVSLELQTTLLLKPKNLTKR
jgi:hypothetical protein